jgi:hypothetical protein
MQLVHFPNGGYVVHKAILPLAHGHFSCWFSPDGKMVDAEQFRGRHYAAHPVRRDGKTWQALEQQFGGQQRNPIAAETC